MMRIAFFIMLLGMFIIQSFPCKGYDVFIAEADQKKRDSDKFSILKNELEHETVVLAEKKYLVSIAEAMNDLQGAKALQTEIEQHVINIDLIKKELNPSKGDGTKKTRSPAKKTVQANQKSEPTESAWWDSYSRNPTISMY